MLNKEQKENISKEILNYLNDIESNPIDDSKKDKDIYSSYLGPIASFVDFFNTKWDEFEQDFEYYLSEVINDSLKVQITNIEPDNIYFNIDDYKVICYIDDEFLVVEWQNKDDK